MNNHQIDRPNNNTDGKNETKKLKSILLKLQQPLNILSNQKTSPPKHHKNIQIDDPIVSSLCSNQLRLQKKNSQYLEKNKLFDEQGIKGYNKLCDFIKNSNIIFKSKFQSNYEYKIRQFQQNLQATPQKKQYMQKPPTPPRKKIEKKMYELKFWDNFESSNLDSVIRHNDSLYYLLLRFDYNTVSYGQWFYFQVKNQTQFDQHFRFVILNMTKSYSLFNQRMKVSVNRCGVWGKQGKDIHYQENKFQRNQFKDKSEKSFYYTLTFTLFLHAHEQIYVAYNQPYTYTRLFKKIDYYLEEYEKISKKKQIKNLKSSSDCKEQLNMSNTFQFMNNTTIKRSTICRSKLNNRIELITIMKQHKQQQCLSAKLNIKRSLNKSVSKKVVNYNNAGKKIQKKQKKIILITSRAHPIETQGSFIMQGIIQQLLQSNYIFQDNYIIKCIPMLNPDGVIIGNTRCNNMGYDLNRVWDVPIQQLTPQIYNISTYIATIKHKIQIVIDIHGHSGKKDYFVYGCYRHSDDQYRQFPYILSKVSENKSVYTQSKFNLVKNQKLYEKQGTARFTLFKKLKNNNVFTLQASYCSNQNSQYHYDEISYKQIGANILKALQIYLAEDQQMIKIKQQTLKQLKQLNKIDNQIENISDSQSQNQIRIVDQAQSYIQMATTKIRKMKSYQNMRYQSYQKQKSQIHAEKSQKKSMRKKTVSGLDSDRDKSHSASANKIKSAKKFPTNKKNEDSKKNIEKIPLQMPKIQNVYKQLHNAQKSSSCDSNNKNKAKTSIVYKAIGYQNKKALNSICEHSQEQSFYNPKNDNKKKSLIEEHSIQKQSNTNSKNNDKITTFFQKFGYQKNNNFMGYQIMKMQIKNYKP